MNTIDRGKLVAVGVLALLGAGVVALFRHDAAPVAPLPDTTTAGEPRQILGRPWFDRLPKSRTDEIDLWFFSSAGLGIHDRGSTWRSTTDFFEFERQSSRLEVAFLHDRKKLAVAFEVKKCDEKPPFDLCLDVREPLRGRKRFYSFARDEEMDANVPWARAWRTSVEVRARAAR